MLTPLPYFVLFHCGTLPYRQNKAVLGKFDCGVARLIVFFVCVENKGIYWAFDGRYEFDNGDVVWVCSWRTISVCERNEMCRWTGIVWLSDIIIKWKEIDIVHIKIEYSDRWTSLYFIGMVFKIKDSGLY